MITEGTIESDSDIQDENALRDKYFAEIRRHERERAKWVSKVKNIIKKYMFESKMNQDDQSVMSDRRKLAMLYSNVQILLPAIFAHLPSIEIERRHKDKDIIARLSSEVLERATDYESECYDLETQVTQSLLDYLLCGRAQARLYLETETAEQPMLDPMTQQPLIGAEGPITQTIITKQNVKIGYVHWEDFYHSAGRVWDEVWMNAYRSYMTKDELVKRFGEEKANSTKLLYAPKNSDADGGGKADLYKKAVIFEVWDSNSKEVLWISEGYDGILDRKSDTLQLDKFFPSPRPLYATICNEHLIPTPDFCFYEDQSKDLDELCTRESGLITACQFRGLYDKSATELASLFTGDNENILIPVSNWAALLGQGGGRLEALIAFAPIQNVVAVLMQVVEAKQRKIEEIYEITGISDILRGSTDPVETATAQNIKSQYGNLRLSKRQRSVERWLRDLLALKAEIIAKHFDPQILRQVSGYDLMIDANPEDPSQWEGIVGLLKDELQMHYRIDIETDSTIALDEDSQKQQWGEFLTNVGGFMDKAIAVIQQAPPMADMMKEMLLMTARKYKGGRSLESMIENSFQNYIQMLQQPQEPQPDPTAMAAQAKVQVDQQRLAQEQQKSVAELQFRQQEMAAKQEIENNKIQLEAAKIQAEVQMKEMELQAKKIEAEMAQQERMQQAVLATTTEKSEPQKAEPVVLNINTAKENGSKRIVLSGPYEARVGVIEPMGEAMGVPVE